MGEQWLTMRINHLELQCVSSCNTATFVLILELNILYIARERTALKVLNLVDLKPEVFDYAQIQLDQWVHDDTISGRLAVEPKTLVAH